MEIGVNGDVSCSGRGFRGVGCRAVGVAKFEREGWFCIGEQVQAIDNMKWASCADYT